MITNHDWVNRYITFWMANCKRAPLHERMPFGAAESIEDHADQEDDRD